MSRTSGTYGSPSRSAQPPQGDASSGLPQSSEAQLAWVENRRSRRRTRWNARARHPLLWAQSVLTRKRGVATTRELPTGANEILERMAEIPLSVWTYGFDHSSVRHIGPMAQDFAAAFGLGASARRIDMLDANGVAMASIQALHRRVVALEKELSELKAAQSTQAPPSTQPGNSADDREPGT